MGKPAAKLFKDQVQTSLKELSKAHRTNHKVSALIDHLRHAMIELHNTQLSVLSGCRVYQDQLLPELTKTFSPRLYQHAFTQLIRLHDAFLLCVSGECRHGCDAKRKRPYASGLTESTSFDKSLTYSGTSWDEIYHEECGIVRRIHSSVAPSRDFTIWWNRILERHSLLDQLLERIETTQLSIQQLIRDLVNSLPRQVSRRSDVKSCTIVWRDKMETSSLSMMNKRSYKYARPASFNVGKSESVVPASWETLLLSSFRKVTKRPLRIIIESDEEEDVGLNVTVKHRKLESPSVATSLHQLKQQYGVRPDQLENSRKMLEQEEHAATMHAKDIDTAPLDTVGGEINLQEELEEALSVLKGQRGALQAAQLNDDRAWLANENLRSAVMQVGNVYIDLQEFDMAFRYFQEAEAIVDRMQSWLNVELAHAGELSRKRYERNLLLIRGQAVVNKGIACFGDNLNTRDGKGALKHLRQAKSIAMRMEELAIADFGEESEYADCAIDCLQSQQLRTLCSRWIAHVNWRIGKREAAANQFLEICEDKFVESEQKNFHLSKTVNSLVEGRAKEQYFAASTLVDLASDFLESATPTALLQNSDKYDRMYTFCMSSYEAAKIISHKINQNGGTTSANQDIASCSELARLKNETRAWWEKKRQVLSSHIRTKEETRSKQTGPQSYDDCESSEVPSTSRQQSTQRGTRRRLIARSCQPSSTRRAKPPLHSKYSPWRNQASSNSLIYPAVARALPDSMKHMLSRASKHWVSGFRPH